MSRLWLALAAGLSLAACASLPEPVADLVPEPEPAWIEACLENGGLGRVQVKWENTLDCDLRPPQALDIVIDERTWEYHSGSAEGWGGDAALAWADQALRDSGCVPEWHGGVWAVGRDCDY